jgi:ATP-dependent RNA helicase DeaD
LPDDVEVYNHRSGRTGRAGREGIAVSIIHMKERGKISQIESVIRRKIERKPVPGGKEICERQLFNLVDRLKNSEVDHDQIDLYIDSVYKQLEELSKEEIIKRFVSLEFNRFLSYYKDSEDLNVEARPERSELGGKTARTSRRGGKSMSRVLFNVGNGKNITKREIIDLFVGAAGMRDLDIGQIEVYKRASAVEVDSKLAKKIIGELNKAMYKGVRVEAEENYEYTGNDFRDRDKGPRGRRKPNFK